MVNYNLLIWKESEEKIRLFLIPIEEICFEDNRTLRLISYKFFSTYKNVDDSKQSRELTIKQRLTEVISALDKNWGEYEVFDIFPKIKDDQHIKRITISGL